MDRRPKMRLASPEAIRMVCWEFTRGTERVACQILRQPDGAEGFAFAVVLLPYRNLGRAVVDTFQNTAAALYRHALLAARLRATGWRVAGYTADQE